MSNSAYQVIARKYRPQTFADVVGQEHITRTLQNALLQSRVGHAYLFVGPRGIGKTTTARIFAKALNCRQPKADAEPCCECPCCVEIAAGRSLDVIEFDAASHNGVEDVRDLRDNLQYAPGQGKYKVYIMDEVHMLTPQAWNALLKTLEEPPPHVKFVFATTEPHKVLATILSRCQRLDLKRIPVRLIAQRLRAIADLESVRIDDAALTAIARAADGGMRDAQSIFDQMIAFCGGRDSGSTIQEQDVTDVFGLASGIELSELAQALLADDLGRIIPLLQSLADRGRNLEDLYQDEISFLRNIMICQICPDTAILDVGAGELEDLRALGSASDAGIVQRLLEGLMGQEGFVKLSANKRVALEVAFIRATREAHSLAIDDVISRLTTWQRQGVTIPPPPPRPAPPPRPPAVPTARAEPEPRPLRPPTPTPPPPAPTASVPTASVPAPAPAVPTPAPAPVAPPVPSMPVVAPIPAPEPSPAASPIAAVPAPPAPVPAAPPPEAPVPTVAAAAPASPVLPAGSNDHLTAWAALCAVIDGMPGYKHIGALLDACTPMTLRMGVLVASHPEKPTDEQQKLLADRDVEGLVQAVFHKLVSEPEARVVFKPWTASVSSSERKPRMASTAEIRDRLSRNAFVQEVCELFRGTIVDVRGCQST